MMLTTSPDTMDFINGDEAMVPISPNRSMLALKPCSCLLWSAVNPGINPHAHHTGICCSQTLFMPPVICSQPWDQSSHSSHRSMLLSNPVSCLLWSALNPGIDPHTHHTGICCSQTLFMPPVICSQPWDRPSHSLHRSMLLPNPVHASCDLLSTLGSTLMLITQVLTQCWWKPRANAPTWLRYPGQPEPGLRALALLSSRAAPLQPPYCCPRRTPPLTVTPRIPHSLKASLSLEDVTGPSPLSTRRQQTEGKTRATSAALNCLCTSRKCLQARVNSPTIKEFASVCVDVECQKLPEE